MKPKIHSPGRSKISGFTLAEVLIASAIVSILVLANMAALYGMRIMAYKDMERGVVGGFVQHYAELVKALPFDQVRENQPISGLYTGAVGTPKIAIPEGTGWVDINTPAYLAFHPGLLWITNRHPQLRVVIEATSKAGVTHDKHLTVEVQWDPPLKVGSTLTKKLDLFRVKDL